VVVTGEYDSAEDWTHLSQDRKNHPPHNGCPHYVAQHAEHPDNRRIWNVGRKTVAPAKQDSVQSQRDAEFQRELENKVWLEHNNQPRPKTALPGDLVEGERRAVRGFVVRTLPKHVPITAEQAAPRRRVLDAGKRRLLPNGQVVMTLPRSDRAALLGVGGRITGVEV
jgi:hypothetical protein